MKRLVSEIAFLTAIDTTSCPRPQRQLRVHLYQLRSLIGHGPNGSERESHLPHSMAEIPESFPFSSSPNLRGAGLPSPRNDKSMYRDEHDAALRRCAARDEDRSS